MNPEPAIGNRPKRSSYKTILLFLHQKTLFLFFSVVLVSSNSFAALRAGIAVRTVTPDPLLPLIGGVGPSHPATRKEGDLTVRALVLEEGPTRIAIVSSDFLGFPSAL